MLGPLLHSPLIHSLLTQQSKHPHVLYEYKDNTPQGCAVTDNYLDATRGGYDRGKRDSGSAGSTSEATVLESPPTPGSGSKADDEHDHDHDHLHDKVDDIVAAAKKAAASGEAEVKVKRDVRSVKKFIEVALVLDKSMFDKRPHSSRKDVIHDAIQVANIADLVSICLDSWKRVRLQLTNHQKVGEHALKKGPKASSLAKKLESFSS